MSPVPSQSVLVDQHSLCSIHTLFLNFAFLDFVSFKALYPYPISPGYFKLENLSI